LPDKGTLKVATQVLRTEGDRIWSQAAIDLHDIVTTVRAASLDGIDMGKICGAYIVPAHEALVNLVGTRCEQGETTMDEIRLTLNWIAEQCEINERYQQERFQRLHPSPR